MGVAAPEEAEVQRPCFGCLQHFSHVEWAAGVDPDGDGAERAADQCGDAAGDGVLAEAGGIEMDVHVDAAGSRDHALAVADCGCC